MVPKDLQRIRLHFSKDGSEDELASEMQAGSWKSNRMPKLGVPTPVNHALFTLVKLLEDR